MTASLDEMRILPINVYKFTSAETSELSCTSASAYNFEASLMNCLYNFCFLVFSCASVRAIFAALREPSGHKGRQAPDGGPTKSRKRRDIGRVHVDTVCLTS